MRKILLTIAILLLVASAGYCQDQPLQLTIKSDKQVYEVGEEIVLEATIRNNSDKEMIVFWNNAKLSLRQEEVGAVTAYLSTFPAEDAETIYIKPESMITKHISIDNTLKLIAFQYRLTFQYDLSSVPIDFLLSLNQRVFKGALTSNTITIEVREKRQAKITKDGIDRNTIEAIEADSNLQQILNEILKDINRNLILPARIHNKKVEDLENASEAIWYGFSMAYPPAIRTSWNGWFFFSGGCSNKKITDFSEGYAIEKGGNKIYSWDRLTRPKVKEQFK